MTPSNLTIAIGDIHGHITKLEALLAVCARRCAGETPRYVFVGDYGDRGPNSRAVVKLMRAMQADRPGEVICLRGNHEQVVIAAARGTLDMLRGGTDMDMWLGPAGGGRQFLESYGVKHARDLPADDIDWMANLPVSHDDGARFFAHAGVNPALPLDRQNEDDLMWIREPFLSYKGKWDRLIVHGHTPVSPRVPDLRPNRLNLDTAAGYGGPISAAIFLGNDREPAAFLTPTGEIAVPLTTRS